MEDGNKIGGIAHVARIPGLVCGACAIEIAARGPLVTHEESPTQQQH